MHLYCVATQIFKYNQFTDKFCCCLNKLIKSYNVKIWSVAPTTRKIIQYYLYITCSFITQLFQSCKKIQAKGDREVTEIVFASAAILTIINEQILVKKQKKTTKMQNAKKKRTVSKTVVDHILVFLF